MNIFLEKRDSSVVSFVGSFVVSSVVSFVGSFTRTLIRSFARRLIRTFVRSFSSLVDRSVTKMSLLLEIASFLHVFA